MPTILCRCWYCEVTYIIVNRLLIFEIKCNNQETTCTAAFMKKKEINFGWAAKHVLLDWVSIMFLILFLVTWFKTKKYNNGCTHILCHLTCVPNPPFIARSFSCAVVFIHSNIPTENSASTSGITSSGMLCKLVLRNNTCYRLWSLFFRYIFQQTLSALGKL